MRRALLIASGLLILGPGAPAHAVTRKQATRIALHHLDLKRRPLAVFALRKPIGARTVIGQTGPAQGEPSTEAIQRGFRTITESSPKRSRAGRKAWLFWADAAPGAYFAHPSGLILVAKRSGRVLRRQAMTWEPTLDGRLPAFLRTAKAYAGKRYRVYAHGVGRRATTASLVVYYRKPSTGPPLPASAGPPIQGPASSAECMVLLRDRYDTATFNGNLATQKQFAADQNMRLYDAANGDVASADLSDAQQHGCTDAVVAVDGHGAQPGSTPLASVLLRATGAANFGQPLIPGFTDHSANPVRGEWFTSQNLRDLLAAHPALTFKVIIDACFSGRWIDDLRDNPPPNLAVHVDSSRPDEESWSDKDPSKPDTFWHGIGTNVEPGAGDKLPGDIFTAVKLKFRPRPDRPIQHPQGYSADQGTFDGSDPENQVSGQIVPNCTTTADIAVIGSYTPDNVWGIGTVTVSPASRSLIRNTVTNGNVAEGSDSFSWECGTQVTLSEKPAMGSHFTGWKSTQGLCSGTQRTCTFAAPSKQTRTLTRVHDGVEADFAPTLYRLNVENADPSGGVVSGGGSIFPAIKCGTNYNGSNTYSYTACDSQARAASSDKDTRSLVFQPNSGSSVANPTQYEVDEITGCDVVTRQGYSAQCSVLLEADRTVTVTWKPVPK